MLYDLKHTELLLQYIMVCIDYYHHLNQVVVLIVISLLNVWSTCGTASHYLFAFLLRQL